MISNPNTKTESYRSFFPYAAICFVVGGLIFYLDLGGMFSSAGWGPYLPVVLGLVVFFVATMLALLGQKSYPAEHPDRR